MRGVGFEPTKVLNHRILSPAPLATREPSHEKQRFLVFKKSLVNPLNKGPKILSLKSEQ